MHWFHIAAQVPHAAGIPAETWSPEFTVDTAALYYLPPTNQKPSRLFLSSNLPRRILNIPANLLLHVLGVPYGSAHVCIGCNRTALLWEKTWIYHVFWHLHVMPPWPLAVGEAVSPAVVEKHCSDLCGVGVKEEDYLRRALLLSSFLCTSPHE